MWNRLFVYRNMVNDIVLDSAMYINKSNNPDPEYWSEELLKIIEKAESDSQLSQNERDDIFSLIEKANEQLNIKLSTAVKTDVENSSDYTRIDKHLQYEKETVEQSEPLPPQPKIIKGEKPQGPLANFSPPPLQSQVQGPVLGDLTKGVVGSSGPRTIDGVPIENFLKDPSKSRFKSLR